MLKTNFSKIANLFMIIIIIVIPIMITIIIKFD
jgi:hypothetical protein